MPRRSAFIGSVPPLPDSAFLSEVPWRTRTRNRPYLWRNGAEGNPPPCPSRSSSMTVVMESSRVIDSGSPVLLRKKVQNPVAAAGRTTPALTVGRQVGIDFACAPVEDTATTTNTAIGPRLRRRLVTSLL